PILQEDLDRVTNVPLAAGSMRANAMTNLALALVVIGHEKQVRAWHAEILPKFPITNFSQPHIMTLWFMDGLFAARDARSDKKRRRHAEKVLRQLTSLRAKTGSPNLDAQIAIIEAELAWARGDLDGASGCFGRAASMARARDFTPLLAYAME